jgi:hypothetical protein
MVVPPAGAGELNLEGPGPFTAIRERFFGVPVNVIGRLCAPALLDRDVVFVSDVSGSMLRSDPIVNTSGAPRCGRLDALDAALAALPSTVQFAIATFDDAQEAASDRFYATKDELYAQIGGGSAADAYQAVCAGIGGTSYTAGLGLAQDLFETQGRNGATKEVFFLTDGEPTDAETSITALADDLKQNGVAVGGGASQQVSIATVMLGAASDVFLRTIASTDQATGQPVHGTASTANQLASIFEGLAGAAIAGATLTHGGNSSSAGNNIDVLAYATNYQFTLPPFTLSLDLEQRSYVLDLESWDTRNQRTTVLGQIDWLD